MKYLNWNYEKDNFLIEKLSEEIFDQDCGVACDNDKKVPTYAGFFNGQLLVMTIDYDDKDGIRFYGSYWSRDDELKKFLTLFYIDNGLYPSFREYERDCIAYLSEI